jgi:hypothetical protein
MCWSHVFKFIAAKTSDMKSLNFRYDGLSPPGLIAKTKLAQTYVSLGIPGVQFILVHPKFQGSELLFACLGIPLCFPLVSPFKGTMLNHLTKTLRHNDKFKLKTALKLLLYFSSTMSCQKEDRQGDF